MLLTAEEMSTVLQIVLQHCAISASMVATVMHPYMVRCSISQAERKLPMIEDAFFRLGEKLTCSTKLLNIFTEETSKC